MLHNKNTSAFTIVYQEMTKMTSLSPYIGVVLVQLAYGGSNILGKLALEQGLDYLVFIVYRHIIAMFILGPLAFFLERKQRPRMTLSIGVKIFMLAMLGTTIHQNVYYAGLDYTSPTVASALSSVIPALTFSLAVLLRLETVNIKEAQGRAKVLGALVCIGGALVFTFWKGPLLGGVISHPLITVSGSSLRQIKDDWIKGAILLLISYVAFSGWLIMQAKVYEVYPARLSTNTLICLFATLQSSVLAIFFSRKTFAWKMGWNIQLVTIIYSGTVISGLAYYLQTYCISKKGPVFNAMFCPLLLVIVGLFSAFFFAERLHLGSLIGSFIVIMGLYTVLWGKANDSGLDQCRIQASPKQSEHVSVTIN